MQLTTSILLFAIGASAAATPHRRHQKFHEKKTVGDVVIATIDGKIVSWVNEYDGGATAAAQATGATPAANVAAVATTTAAAAVSEATETASSSSSSSSGASAGNTEVTEYTAFCSSASKGKRATLQEIAYKGNVGTGTYGCNLQLVSSSIASQYDYTMTFSAASADQACVCWNKIGEDGGINGWFGDAPLSFSLPAGTSQVVAVDADSQGGCACAPGSVPKDSVGEWAATWAEFDMANTSNDGCSGADVSAIIAQTAGLDVQALSICTSDGSQCSSLGAGATDNELAYVKGMEAADGVGINLGSGPVALKITVG